MPDERTARADATDLPMKRRAAAEAAGLVQNGQRLGLGSGTTAALFIEALGRRIEKGELKDVAGVPTSGASEEVASRCGVPLTTLDRVPRLDLAVDGADQIDPALNLVKGMGGALLREKIVASASERLVVIADETKIVERLGDGGPVPIEVLPFGWRPVAGRVVALGGEPILRREREDLAETDQGNVILDCDFGLIEDPFALASALDAIPGVLGHGLFLGMAERAIVGTPKGIDVVFARVRRGETEQTTDDGNDDGRG